MKIDIYYKYESKKTSQKEGMIISMSTRKNTLNCDNTNTFIYNLPTVAESIKLLSIEEKSLRKIINKVLIDVDKNSDTLLFEYGPVLRYNINIAPIKNGVLLECAEWLEKTVFETFSVKQIYVRYNKKEILVISDKISDDILSEFYDKTFDFAYMKDSEIVFLITDENSVDYSVMPKYDLHIEVGKHE